MTKNKHLRALLLPHSTITAMVFRTRTPFVYEKEIHVHQDKPMPKNKPDQAVKKVEQNTMTYQSNELIDSVYRLSVPSKRVLLMCLGKVGKTLVRDQPQFASGFKCHVTVADYAAAFDVELSQASDDMAQALRASGAVSSSTKLTSATPPGELLATGARFTFLDEKTGNEVEDWLPWFARVSAADVKTGRGEYMLYLNTFLLDHIGELKDQYTAMDLKDCGRLSSFNQMRLFEKFSQYKSTGIWRTTPAEFRDGKYDLGDSIKKYPNEIKRRFLLDAIDAINETTPLFIRFEDLRGKWVFHIYKGTEAQKLTMIFRREKAEKELKEKEAKRLAKLQKAAALPPVE